MRYFITGASGWIGSAVSRELIAAGHRVSGLARSDASAEAMASFGADVVRGSLTDPDVLRDAASAADGVVHLAFTHDFNDFETASAINQAAVEAIASALEGSGKTLAIASGVAGLVQGRPATENDAGDRPVLRQATERYVLALAGRGIRPLSLRFAPTVHGTGGDHGFIKTIAQIARQHGVSGYIGDGSARWAAVHRDDAAHLARLALESSEPGGVVHAVGEEGVPTKVIAEAVGARLGVPTASIAAENAVEHFDWIGRFFGQDFSATSDITRARYGWEPTHPTLLEDIAAGGYDVPRADAA